MGEMRVVHGLGNVRFAANPLSELALSTMIVRYPQDHPFHAAWFRDTAEGRNRVGVDRIVALINPRKDIPDLFLRPAGPKATTFDAELRRIAAVPTRRWKEDFTHVWPDGLPAPLRGTDSALRSQAIDILADYWEACFASYWRGFKTVLDADVTYRARQLAAIGPKKTLADVSKRWIVQGQDLVLPMRGDYCCTWDAEQHPLTMLPTLVKWNHNVPNREAADPVCSYRARGRGRLSESEADTAPGLVGVFGKTRTELLLSLDEPASSTAIALFMGVTVSAVNQHLRALAAARLLETRRFGRYVLYARSELADAMIQGQGRELL